MHRHLHHPLKASILAVGTEITAGEILNSNAATLAAHLTEFGYVCDLHLTVPDDRDLMAWAIKHAMAEHGLVIITGGLGPTTDDFTRDVIGLVANRKPVWDESSWAAIVTRLNSLNAPTAKSNRQQASSIRRALTHKNLRRHFEVATFLVAVKRLKVFLGVAKLWTSTPL